MVILKKSKRADDNYRIIRIYETATAEGVTE